MLWSYFVTKHFQNHFLGLTAELIWSCYIPWKIQATELILFGYYISLYTWVTMNRTQNKIQLWNTSSEEQCDFYLQCPKVVFTQQQKEQTKFLSREEGLSPPWLQGAWILVTEAPLFGSASCSQVELWALSFCRYKHTYAAKSAVLLLCFSTTTNSQAITVPLNTLHLRLPNQWYAYH